MGLSEIAAGLEVTAEQREQGVATVDRTDASLAARLGSVAEELPCNGPAAATLLETYATGASIEAAGAAAGLAPITAAKTLHRCGESVTPVTPLEMEIIEDWLAGDLSRSDAEGLVDAGERTFSLAVYVATHEPLPAARDAKEGALAEEGRSSGHADGLEDAVSGVGDLL